MNITAIIPTHNEEKNIEAVLNSVLFADEIIVIDSYSQDDTLKIAEKYPVKIIQREYINSANQKNWIIPQALNEWILLVDADERVSPELEIEIKKTIENNPIESAFWIYRKNYFMGRHMKHSGLNTDKVIRLFKRDCCVYEEKNVHAEIVTEGKVGFLREKLIHNTYVSFDDYIDKKNRYAWWSAKDYLSKKTKINISNLIFKPFYRFIKHYFLQLGILDGIPGLTYAFIESYSVFTRYIKIGLMQKGQYENHPANKPKFVLYISYSYGIPILKPLEKALKERGFEVAWYLEISNLKNLLQSTDVILKNTKEVFTFEPSIIFASSNEVPPFFPGLKVQVFHGFNVSKRSDQKGHFRIRGLFDLYCTQGPSTTIPFKNLEKKYGHFKVVETGWPKMDLLFPIKPHFNKKPTILLASTFTKTLSLAHKEDVFNKIKEIMSTGKYDWIINLHPKMDGAIVQKYKQLAQLYNFDFVVSPKNLEHLEKSDILLTDTSSIITEFILQEKPVVTFRNKSPKKHHINIENVSELEKAFEYGLSKPSQLMQSIKDFNAQEHPFKDGKSSDRVIDAALSMHYNLEKIRLKHKPLNLIRKYKLTKKIG